jgi:excisionase family DNA binding protein
MTAINSLPQLERLLSPEDVADILKVTKKTVYRYVRNKTLPHERVGPLIRIRPSELQKFLQVNAARDAGIGRYLSSTSYSIG